MSLKKLQTKIENAYPRAIRLEKTKRKRKESLREFLIKLFTEWGKEKNTVYVDNHEVQTDTGSPAGSGRRRSLGDLFMICKYYYPDLELEKLVKELFVKLPMHFEKGFRTSYCFTINKRVWYYAENRDNNISDKTKNDEWGNPYRFYLAAVAPNGAQLQQIDANPDDDNDEEAICDDCGEYVDECEC